MKRLSHLAVVALLSLLSATSHAQTDDEYRMEIGAGVGTMAYEGDFNGNVMKGMQPMASFVLRRVWNPYTSLKMSASYGKIKGGSANVDTWLPDYADSPYEFDRGLIDMTVAYEYNFWPYGTGRDYRGTKRLTPFVSAGLGLTCATKGGSTVTGNLPIGVGVKYKMGKRLNLGVEWTAHFSLSDNLDGVKDPYGIESTGLFKNTDCYTTLQVTLTYSFMAKCRTCHNDD